MSKGGEILISEIIIIEKQNFAKTTLGYNNNKYIYKSILIHHNIIEARFSLKVLHRVFEID